jgi:glycerol-3-phosphate acyltransferase PlsY
MLTYLMQRTGVLSGWLLLAIIGVGVVSYALGCFNGAVMVSRGILKDDIRKHGSGNGGLTNFCRIHGGVLSLVVIFIDVIKAVLSLLLAGYIFSYLSPAMVVPAKYWAAFCCILGHMFPCMFQFRGGKGAMSSGAIALMIDWRLALAVWGCFLICVIATKYISLGSCVGAVAFSVASILIYKDPIITVLSIVMSLMVLLKHSGNIVRLCKGTESKFTFARKGKRNDKLATTETVAPAEEEPVIEPTGESSEETEA